MVLSRLAAVRRLLGLALAVLPVAPAGAAEVAIGLRTEPSAIDPQFAILGANQQISEQIFDTLVMRDDKLHLAPGLAVSWRLVDDTTWEFKLRDDVVFHDGSKFSAEDAVFTIARAPAVPNSPASYAPAVSHIAEAVAVDPATLRIRTKWPYPTLPLDLTGLYVISKRVAEHATTDDFNKGTAAIGTGAYRFVEWLPGQRLVLERNERYWGPKPAIERPVFRVLPSDPSRVAALLAGDVVLIEAVLPADLAQLKKNPSIAVWNAASTRLIYLHMDTARGTTPFALDKAGNALDKNPLQDHRVRLALSKAINRQAIVERILEGSASVAGQMVPEGLVGWNPEIKPERYDPEGAKKLLAEAGYPDGFRLTLHGPNNRYVGDEKVALAIAQMWARIGVDLHARNEAGILDLPYRFRLGDRRFGGRHAQRAGNLRRIGRYRRQQPRPLFQRGIRRPAHPSRPHPQPFGSREAPAGCRCRGLQRHRHHSDPFPGEQLGDAQGLPLSRADGRVDDRHRPDAGIGSRADHAVTVLSASLGGDSLNASEEAN